MRNTIKITKAKAIDVQALNGRVLVVFTLNGAEAMRQEIERMPALLAAASLSAAARMAEANPAYETERVASVKVAPGKYFTVWPSAGRVVLNVDIWGMSLATNEVDVHTAAALATAIELSSAEIGAGARCHGDQCAAGQIACPSPKACGVEA
ncbi:hypothetical protein RAE21_06305 [Rhodoferax sp. TBRC 17198]|uniref:hypothetical protein n=1 Tax=Rhodoferax potami TaxID=3068338 RepID=UPI0028BF1FD2|nr:hypothetical protein [Rhodoferax sp. TBRC 17198]MDT7522023.1 hypothetical protein [Rhodoferax sp. TBRC 17198]